MTARAIVPTLSGAPSCQAAFPWCVQPHVVQERLGHSNIGTTMNIYAHVIPAQQKEAARLMGTSLHG